MTKYKVPKWVEKIISTELYQFWDNKKALEEMCLDEIEKSVDGNNFSSAHTIQSSVENAVIRINSSRMILETRRRLKYIENAFKLLNNYELEIVEIIFKERYNQKLAESQKFVSRHSYYNVKDKIIYFTAKEFGYI